MPKMITYAMGALGACLLAAGIAQAGTVNQDHGVASMGCDPAAFSIVEGKLYLNYSTKARDSWQKDEPGYIHKADEAWPAVSQRSEVIH